MSTSLAPAFGAGSGLISREDLARSLNNAAMTMPRVGGDKLFLKMDKGNGEWVYGQEETLVEDSSLWAVNPASLLHGYISWDMNQQVEGEVMVPISRAVPDDSQLRVKGSPDGTPTGEHGWQFQMAFDMVCIKGEDAGVIVQYKQSSVGAMKAFRSITDAIGAQLEAGKDEIVPVVRMKSDSYKHKKWGRIHNPVFEIVEWRSMDDNSPVGSDGTGTTEQNKAEASAETDTRRARVPQRAAVVEPEEDSAEEAALAREYTAEAEAVATPRRRTRR